MIVITGGLGFIGSELARELTNRFANEIAIVDNLSTGSVENVRDLVDDATIIFLDVSEPEFLRIFQAKDVDLIFHLGMPSSSPMYRADPSLIAKVTANISNVLELCRKKDCPLVYASTSSIYNRTPTFPMKETDPILATDFYPECRYSLERFAKIYNDLYGIRSVGLRLFSVYGKSELYKGSYANMLSQFIWSILKGEKITIYGDGTQTRDFIYSKDVVEAFIRSSELNADFEIINVGTGIETSFNDAIFKIAKTMQRIPNVEYIPNLQKNYVMRTVADTAKFKRLLNINTTTLDDGIKMIVDHYTSILVN